MSGYEAQRTRSIKALMDRNEFSFDHVGNVTKILMLMKNLHNEKDMDV